MKKILASIIVGVFPLSALAQTYTPSLGINGLFGLVSGWVSYALPLVISIAIVWFVWNVFRYAVAGDEEQKAKSRTDMVWGIVAIFVMVSIWGLVSILQNTFGTQNATANFNNTLPINLLNK